MKVSEIKTLEEFIKDRARYNGHGIVGKNYWETRDLDVE